MLWLTQCSLLQLLATGIFISIGLIFYYYYIVPYRRLRSLGVKYAVAMPFIGNMFDYGAGNQHIAQVKFQQRFGQIWGTLFFYMPAIWIGNPSILKSVMIKEFSNFTNRVALNRPRPPFSKAVVQLRDQDWKRVRTILVPTFTTAKLKAIVPIIADAGDNLINTLSDAEQEGRVIDMWRTCGNFTMRVILGTAFGIQIESKEQEQKLTEAAGVLFRSISGVRQFLFIFFTPLFRLLEPLLGGKVMSSVLYLIKTTRNVLQERRRNLKNGIPCRKDILQEMIEAGDNDKLSDDEIIAQAIIFLIAGYETTANTLGFSSYLLATNPNIQEKLRNEIDAKCPDTDAIDYDTLFELPYLDMVISETLRLYPPAFFVNREVKEDITIDGLFIPKDVMIGIPIYGIHHNPEIWPKPEEFIPERFSPEEKAKHATCSFIPFGGGPRNCIGMRLALLEAKLALVKILQQFKLKAVNETEVPLKLLCGATLSPANGVHLGLSRRC